VIAIDLVLSRIDLRIGLFSAVFIGLETDGPRRTSIVFFRDPSEIIAETMNLHVGALEFEAI